jgi:hypothetical protein
LGCKYTGEGFAMPALRHMAARTLGSASMLEAHTVPQSASGNGRICSSPLVAVAPSTRRNCIVAMIPAVLLFVSESAPKAVTT